MLACPAQVLPAVGGWRGRTEGEGEMGSENSNGCDSPAMRSSPGAELVAVFK